MNKNLANNGSNEQLQVNPGLNFLPALQSKTSSELIALWEPYKGI